MHSSTVKKLIRINERHLLRDQDPLLREWTAGKISAYKVILSVLEEEEKGNK